jgi:hypothetical protein
MRRSVIVLVTFALLIAVQEPMSGQTRPRGIGAFPKNPGIQVTRYEGMTLLVTQDVSQISEVRGSLAEIGGHAVLTFEPNVIIAYIPEDKRATIRSITGIMHVRTAVADPLEVGVTDPNALEGLRFFNAVLRGEVSNSRSFSIPDDVDREGFCTVRLPYWALRDQAEKTSGLSTMSTWPNASLTGDVRVNVFMVESDGSIDSDEFTWTTEDHNLMANEIWDGLWWWWEVMYYILEITPNPIGMNLRYRGGTYDLEVFQPYEPIRRSSLDEPLWAGAIMQNLGYNQAHYQDRIAAFNEDERQLTSSDQSFSIFAIYNPPAQGAPAQHLDGVRAFAYPGLHFSMLFRNGSGRTPEMSHRVAAHEIGHIFWACDEYQSGCQITSCGNCFGYGPRPSHPNTNCETCSHQTACIMHQIDGGEFENLSICDYTKAQVGW